MPFTHAEQQTLVLLDGAEASQKTRHHDNAAEGDDEIGGGERREGGRQGGEAALRHRQPQAHTQEPAAAELKRAHRKLRFSDNVFIAPPRPIYRDVTGTHRELTQKSRLKRNSMYLMQQMQPRAMMGITGHCKKNDHVSSTLLFFWAATK